MFKKDFPRAFRERVVDSTRRGKRKNSRKKELSNFLNSGGFFPSATRWMRTTRPGQRAVRSGLRNSLAYLSSDDCLNRQDIGGSVVLQDLAGKHVADTRVEPHEFALQKVTKVGLVKCTIYIKAGWYAQKNDFYYVGEYFEKVPFQQED